jgi:hypothetical protein
VLRDLRHTSKTVNVIVRCPLTRAGRAVRLRDPMMSAHLHRPRQRGDKPRPPNVRTLKVTGPYRAEHRRRKTTGAWRENVEEAFADARILGNGAVVVSSEHVLLAKFENAMKLAGPEPRGSGVPKTHKTLSDSDELPGEEAEPSIHPSSEEGELMNEEAELPDEEAESSVHPLSEEAGPDDPDDPADPDE